MNDTQRPVSHLDAGLADHVSSQSPRLQSSVERRPESHLLSLLHLLPWSFPSNRCLDMTSRINIARPAGRGGYSPDPHGLSNNRPPSSGYRAANPDDPLEKARQLGKTVEDNVEIYTQPLKPHLPAIGRFLIVVTFLEDSIRILTQWGDQLWYLQK